MTRNSIKQQPETPVLRKGTKRPLPDIPTFWYDYDNGRIIFPDHRDFHKHTEKQVERNMPLDSLFSGIQRRTNYDDPTVKRIRLFIRAGTHVENQPVRDYFRRVKEWKLIPGSFKPDAIHATYSHNGFKVYLYSGSSQDLGNSACFLESMFSGAEERNARIRQVRGSKGESGPSNFTWLNRDGRGQLPLRSARGQRQKRVHVLVPAHRRAA